MIQVPGDGEVPSPGILCLAAALKWLKTLQALRLEMEQSIIIGVVIGVLLGLHAKAADIRHSRIADDAGFILVQGILE